MTLKVQKQSYQYVISVKMNFATIDNYEIGTSKFYVVLETPLPLTQAVNSPVPPPRQRHNPFNKPEGNTPHQRSHSLRSSNNSGNLRKARASAGCDGSDFSLRLDERPVPASKISITFRELHNAYGRPILRDFNFWKNEKKHLLEKSQTVDNLISF
jgi:hypothetical protein